MSARITAAQVAQEGLPRVPAGPRLAAVERAEEVNRESVTRRYLIPRTPVVLSRLAEGWFQWKTRRSHVLAERAHHRA